MTNVFTKTIFAVALLCVVSIPTAALANDLNKVASTVKQYRVVETNNGGGNLIVWLEKTANTSGTLAACASDDYWLNSAFSSHHNEEVMDLH